MKEMDAETTLPEPTVAEVEGPRVPQGTLPHQRRAEQQASY